MLVRITVAAVSLLGLLFGAIGLLTMSWGPVIAWSFIATLAGVGAWHLVDYVPTRYKSKLARWSKTAVATMTGCASLAACLVFAGIAALFGGVLTVSILAFFTVSGTVIGFYGHRMGRNKNPTAGISDIVTESELPIPPDPAALSTAELCAAWRHSYVQLERAVAEPARQRLVRLREQYLDELEKRDPVGLDRWLRSGARAAGNPLPYLRIEDASGHGDAG